MQHCEELRLAREGEAGAHARADAALATHAAELSALVAQHEEELLAVHTAHAEELMGISEEHNELLRQDQEFSDELLEQEQIRACMRVISTEEQREQERLRAEEIHLSKTRMEKELEQERLI